MLNGPARPTQAGFLGFDAFVRWGIDVGGLHLLPSQIFG